jgi:CSLREA domain-containing protein
MLLGLHLSFSGMDGTLPFTLLLSFPPWNHPMIFPLGRRSSTRYAPVARRQPHKPARPERFKPLCESLEDRLAPAVVTVTTTADDITPNDGSVSLREAITAINAGNDLGDPDLTAQNPGTFGTNDAINFNMPGAGVKTINVGSDPSASGIPLPTIVKPVVINGYTQGVATANTLANADNAVIRIELNGTGAGTAVNGLTLGAGSDGSTMKGLAINRFQADASLNGGVGILVLSNGNTIVGNFVGVNPAGTMQFPNGGDGIRLLNASNNQIGTTAPASRNLVSGNILDGIHVEGSLTTPATGNLIQGNFVGVAANGMSRVGVRTAPVPNAAALGTDAGNFLFGIEISGGNNNTVGGSAAGARNVVGFNGAGIEVDNGGQMNVIQGNFSGVGADGVTPVKNLLHGIVLRSSNTFNAPLGPAQPNEPGTSNNLIGGTVAGAGNTVEFNGTGGIAVFGNPVSASGQPNIGNAILGNSIFENGRSNPGVLLGIDLSNQFKFPSDDGFTPNDSRGHGAANDPNNFQDFAVLTSATQSGGTTIIMGTLTPVSPNTTFRIEFFSSPPDPLHGTPEGKTFLGFLNVTTDSTGKAAFTFTTSNLSLGAFVTATATGSNNTSEFSPGVQVVRLVTYRFVTQRVRAGTEVRVFDAETGAELFDVVPFRRFFGKLLLAAGDVNHDGVLEVIVAQGRGGRSLVRIFDGHSHRLFISFRPIAGTTILGVSASDLNGDGFTDVFVVFRRGRRRLAKVFDGKALAAGQHVVLSIVSVM